MGGFKHRHCLGEGCVARSVPKTTHPMWKTWYFRLCDSCTDSRHQLLCERSNAFLRQAPMGADSHPTQAWLELIVHMLYIPSEWVDWPQLVGRKDGGKVELASYMIYLHPPKQGQISLSKATVHQWINNHTSISLLFQWVVVVFATPTLSPKEGKEAWPPVSDKTASTLRTVFFSKLNFSHN